MGVSTTFIVEFNGTNAGTGFDQLFVNGSVTLCNATLVVTINRPLGIGNPSRPYILEPSTNLVNWCGIQTNTASGSGVYFFVDPQFGLLPERFYRVQSP